VSNANSWTFEPDHGIVKSAINTIETFLHRRRLCLPIPIITNYNWLNYEYGGLIGTALIYGYLGSLGPHHH